MRVCSKNHAHRRLGPVRCETPGCHALVVEIDDPPAAPSGIAPPIGAVTSADFAEDRPEVASEPENEDEALAPKSPSSEPVVEPEVPAVEAASQPKPNAEPRVADAFVAKELPPTEPPDVAALHPKPIPDPRTSADLQAHGSAPAHFGAQNQAKTIQVRLQPAPGKADALKNDERAPERDAEATSDPQTATTAAAPVVPGDAQKQRQKGRRAPAAIAALIAASIGFYLFKHDAKQPEPDPAAQAWSKIENSRDPHALQDFALKFPGSPFADLANRIAARLAEEQRLADRKQVEQIAASRRRAENAEPPAAPSETSRIETVPEQAAGVGPATPSEVAKEVIEALQAERAAVRGWIGVQIQPLTHEIAESLGLKSTSGALVAVAQPDAPAARAGVVSGDVITSVNGEPIERPRDLARKIAAMGPNVPVTLGYVHDGVEKTATVKLGRLLENKKADTPMTGLAAFGLSLSPAATLAGGGKDGAVVTEIDPAGAAARKGLRAGDVILEAGGKPVSGPDDVVEALDEARRDGHRPLLLRVKSGGATHYLTLPPDAS